MKSVIFKNKKYSLFREPLKKGSFLNFVATTQELEDKEFKFKGLTLISSFPSISTKVCDAQTIWLSKIANKYPDLNVLAISMDLPFTLSEWCVSHGVNNITVLSDYKEHVFGRTTGLLINQLHLLARASILVNKSGKILQLIWNKDSHSELPFEEVEEAIIKNV